MTLRRSLAAYLIAVHVPFAIVAYFLFAQNHAWLFVIELTFVATAWGGVWLMRSLFGTLDELRAASHLLRERDYNSRFREVGHPEIDEVIRIYNRMAEELREERVRQEEKNYFVDRILNASPSGVITLDLEGRVVLVNPSAEKIVALPASAMLDKKLGEVDHPFVVSLGDLAVGESKVVSVAGGRRVRCQRSEFVDRGFARSFFLLEEMTDELRRSEKAAYEKLIRMMSHEVNNSIAASRSLLESCLHYADQLRDDDRDDFSGALRVVLDRTAQLGAFVNDYADVVRLPSPRRAPVDLHELLRSMTVLFREEARRREVTFHWEVDDDFSPLPLDRVQIEQVLVNVIKNALEAIGEKGRITFRLGLHNGRPRLIVEDTGGGLTTDAQAKLFTPFFSTKQNGRGLGLTIAREILTLHECSCSLEGEKGEATRFTVLF